MTLAVWVFGTTSVWISTVWSMGTGNLDCVVFVNVNTCHYEIAM